MASGPTQQILRPSQLEEHSLAEQLTQAALFGPTAILSSELGTVPRIEKHCLLLEQDDLASILIDGLGTLRIIRPVAVRGEIGFFGITSLIEKDVREKIRSGLRYAGWVLDQIDSLHRLADFSVVAAIQNAGHLPWRTRAEQEASPDSTVMSQASENVVASLNPPTRKRPMLALNATEISEDLMVLLRREFKGQR